MTAQVTRGERDDLLKLVRARTRVAKAQMAQHAARMRAEFEAQLGRQYAFDENTVWEAATKAATIAVQAAQVQVDEECARLGIPPEFRPVLSGPSWYRRGENASKDRRVELRRIAHSQIDALEREANAEIERRSVEAQSAILVSGLGDAARAFLEQLPTPEALMAPVNVEAVTALLGSRNPPHQITGDSR